MKSSINTKTVSNNKLNEEYRSEVMTAYDVRLKAHLANVNNTKLDTNNPFAKYL
jgi:muramidase (phage lysozyme)